MVKFDTEKKIRTQIKFHWWKMHLNAGMQYISRIQMKWIYIYVQMTKSVRINRNITVRIWKMWYMICILLAHCEGNLPVTGGFPSQRASIMWKVFPCHDVVIQWPMKPSCHQVPHYDVIKWKHFPRYRPFFFGGGGGGGGGSAGDRAHYDVTVMQTQYESDN